MAIEKSSKVPRRRGRKGDNKRGKVPHSQKRKNGADSQSFAAKNNHHHHSTTLLIQLTEDTPNWYSCGRQTPGRDDTLTSHPPSSKNAMTRDVVAQYRSQADELYKCEVSNFRNSSSSSSSSDDQWVENTMKRGTLKDRIAAMSVVVSTNPVHKLHALDGLLSMAANPNARMAQMAAEACEDLFLRTLLPPHRKLLSLEQRPLYLYQDGTKTLSPRILLLWRYEELLKEKYQLFLSQYLLHTLQNGMDVNKLAALRTASVLLRETPEGEAQLLSMLVNKLGDPSKKIAAAAGHQLRQVLEQHVNMQLVVAREVQQLAHRPHLSPRALYNCIIFLNQLQLSAEDITTTVPKQSEGKKHSSKAPKKMSLPASLVQTYFRLFEVAVKNDSEIKSRLLSALLTGVNRAHPYLPEQDKDLEEHVDSLYRVVHSGLPSASTQALMLLFHVAVGSHDQDDDKDSTKSASTQVQARQDRFYRALYATLSQPSIVGGGKHLTMYFNLLYKAMKYDSNTTRVISFAKRLLSTTMHTSPPVTAASLFLLSEVMKTQDSLKSCFADIAQGDSAMAVLDASKREPMAALIHGGESVAYAHLWESCLLQNHYHPSVSKFASGNVEYTGDPLRDFSLAPFLDKFAYRNPKSKTKGKRGESVAERRANAVEKESSLPLNDPSFLEKQDVNEQEEFFHKFFVERARRDEKKGIVRERNRDDNDEEDEAFDIAEKFNTDQSFEEAWETDSEEEAFVDSLAEKLIEDAAEADMDLDDEDPDMEGWDDMYDGEKAEDSSDEDAFMDKMDDMSNELDEKDPQLDGDDDEDGDDGNAFMDASSSDDTDSDDNDSLEPTFRETATTSNADNDESSDDESSGSDNLVFMHDSESDDEDDANQVQNQSRKSRHKGDSDDETFADASAYEELINKGWKEIQEKRTLFVANDVIDAEDTAASNLSYAGKKGKRRSKKKRRTS